jgi:iron complex outermembrane recepter protein
MIAPPPVALTWSSCRDRLTRLHAVRPDGVRRLALGIMVLLCAAAAPAGPVTFADFTLEELMNESVSSVAKRETKLSESPAAVAVLSGEEIRSSGLTSLPEMLRQIPGMQVARIHGNEWAVSARGFNGQYANKLLVLVDGRSVYSPMFAGVYWNTQDVLIDDLARIEVIRGPGAALWGANAVNGVINVMTKSASETQGGILRTNFGTEERPSVALRYGGKLAPDLSYRVYAQYADREGIMKLSDGSTPDASEMKRIGARADWEPETNDHLTLQAEYYQVRAGEHFEGVTLTPPFATRNNVEHQNFGGHLVGRWTRRLIEGELSIQAFFDRFHQGDGDTIETRDTFDLEAQHRFTPGVRHEVVWGAGFRHTTDRLSPSFYLTFSPERQLQRIYNFFAQDEITLVPDRLKFTIGSKLEHRAQTGFEVQPSARLLWLPADRQTIWTSVSRAVRTASRYDRDARLNAAVFQPTEGPPVLVALLSSPDAQSEELMAYEVGYRIEPHPRFAVDVTSFYNRYDGILGYVPGDWQFEAEPAPAHLVFPLHFENLVHGYSYGGEVLVQLRPTDAWRITASYSLLGMQLRLDDAAERESPRHQAHLRSSLDLAKGVQLHGAAYYVGGVESPLDNDRAKIDACLRLDLGLSWRVTSNLEVAAWGRNLLDPGHPEFGSFKTGALAEIPRSFLGTLKWSF